MLDIQAESDVTRILESSVVRQPDSDRFRLWEVAGTAHADLHLLGAIADLLHCGTPINNGPMYIVADAALHRLEDWVSTRITRALRVEAVHRLIRKVRLTNHTI